MAMPDRTIRDDLLDILETVSKAQLRALRRLRQPPRAGTGGRVGAPVKRMSHINMIYDILRSAEQPLHISEILIQVSKRFGVELDRESAVSALAKRVARKDRFVRSGPNTYSILPEG
jgi:hypothetical protein